MANATGWDLPPIGPNSKPVCCLGEEIRGKVAKRTS